MYLSGVLQERHLLIVQGFSTIGFIFSEEI